MIFRFRFIFLIALMLSVSCNERSYQNDICNKIDSDSLIQIKGVAYISSKDTIIFHKSDFIKSRRYGRKLHLIPCNEGLKNYIFEEYDNFIYLKNHNDHFWMKIEGQYLTSDTLRRPQQFLLKTVTILNINEN